MSADAVASIADIVLAVFADRTQAEAALAELPTLPTTLPRGAPSPNGMALAAFARE